MTDANHQAKTIAVEYLDGLKSVLNSLSIDGIAELARRLHDAYEQGRQVLIIGNGGSAATASHLACDLAKTVLGAHPTVPTKRFRVIALTDNVPLLTAWANDVGYETVFSEQLRNLAQPNDILIVISASGNSKNIVHALEVAQELGLTTTGLLGFSGGEARNLLDHSIVVQSDNYGYIEDAHMILGHLLTAYFKQMQAAMTASA